MKFSKLEMGIYLLIANTFESSENLCGHEYSGGYRSGNVLIGDKSDPIQVVFSFPLKSDDCYFMITDGDVEELAKEMAALQEYNEGTDHLCKDHTVPSKSSYLNEAGWLTYLITSPHVSHVDFPLTHEINSRKIRFHLALPLTESERVLKIESGIDALFDEFEKNNRDTITFNQLYNEG